MVGLKLKLLVVFSMLLFWVVGMMVNERMRW
jgi:hypothetical protein